MKNFSNSLQFRIPAVFIVSFLFVMGAIFVAFSTVGKDLLQQESYKNVIMSGQNIVSELGNRIVLAESLVTALANLGETLPPDNALHKKLISNVLNYEGAEAFIAGGGIWPAPYQYQPAVERRSFFWGRDSKGQLHYYDNYNDPQGPGYHQQEWYVPAQHLEAGGTFWSKSYVDPYSQQPMVTVAAPMIRGGSFYGVATVDLKLEGLHSFLEHVSQSFGGYAFAVDRNGKFLSFPDEALTQRLAVGAGGAATREYIGISELAATQTSFRPLASAVQDAIAQVVLLTQKDGSFDAGLANTIEQESYQIEETEAQLIAAVLASPRLPEPDASQFQQLLLDHDLLLAEPAFAAVFSMPHTYWQVVTVMPRSKALETSAIIYDNLAVAIAVAMLVSLIVMLILVRRILVRPLSDMSKQLQVLSGSGSSDTGRLVTSDQGELGELAFWFNRRSQRLLEVQDELRRAHGVLEQRVVERTRELQVEIEKREKIQGIKDAQALRVERQYAAIVELTLHKSLFTENLVTAAHIINEVAARTMDAARCGIWLVDEGVTNLELLDLYQQGTVEHPNTLQFDVEKFTSYIEALGSERSIVIPDLTSDPRAAAMSGYARASGVSAVLASPIRIGGKLKGVICFEHEGGSRNWYDDEIRFSGEITERFIQVLANAARIKSESQIRRLAFYDPLTALANRRLLHETVQHQLSFARRHQVFGSLLYLDLDNFKTLNDSLGHGVGDELLVQLAQRLKATLRAEDMASRVGGDEFVVLINSENATREEAMDQALTVAFKLQAVIGEPYHLQGYEHTITSSMGITLYPENDGSAADLLKQADTAMYRAKADGRNRFCFYNPAMQREADLRLLLENELRAAIAHGELEMYYQPQVDFNGACIGAEALVRWNHPTRGLVSPQAFIPIAEETGLILELGEWILAEVCEFSSQLEIRNMAVNISPLQFRQAGFVDSVKQILDQVQLDPDTLIIELTEGILIENFADTVSKIDSLQQLGIRVAIDDFGTGYSSLAYLKQLPLDQLKISNDFVRDITTDPNSAILVDTIISMARHMGLKIVAEGVETAGQLGFLSDKGCHIYQGYYFSKPLQKARFIDYLGLSGDPGRM